MLRIDREKGQWIARDNDAGYYRKITPSEAHLILADLHNWSHLKELIMCGKLKDKEMEEERDRQS